MVNATVDIPQTQTISASSFRQALASLPLRLVLYPQSNR